MNAPRVTRFPSRWIALLAIAWVWAMAPHAAASPMATARPHRAHVAALAIPSLHMGALDFRVHLPSPRLEQGELETIVHLSVGGVPPLGVVESSFVVPRLERMSAMLLGQHVKLEFQSPAGKRFVPGTTRNGHGFESTWTEGIGGASFTRVEPGRWIVRARADGGPDSGSYFVEVKTRDPRAGVAHLECMPLDKSLAPEPYARDGDPVYIRAFVVQGDSVRRDVTWDLRATNAEGNHHWSIPTYDDGQHADSLAGDGIAVGVVRASDDERFVSILAEGRGPDGATFGAMERFEVEVVQDLGIHGPIDAVPPQPVAGRLMVLKTNVFNAGKRDRQDIEMELYVDDALVSKQSIALAAGASRTISMPWTPPEPRPYKVKIIVDPFGEPDDRDLANNSREIQLSVR